MSSADLMSRCCTGDASAMRALYDRYARVVLAYAREATGDERIAAAVVEATFVELCARRHAYVAGADPGPWIVAIARRQIALTGTSPDRGTARRTCYRAAARRRG